MFDDGLVYLNLSLCMEKILGLFGSLPLQFFNFGEICHYNSPILKLAIFYVFWVSGPLSSRIRVRIFCMDKNTPAASLSLHSLTCGPHTSASPSTSSHLPPSVSSPSVVQRGGVTEGRWMEGRRPMRWEGHVDTAKVVASPTPRAGLGNFQIRHFIERAIDVSGAMVTSAATR